MSQIQRPPIAANLRQLKAQSGLTYAAIAKKLGRTERTVQRWAHDDYPGPSWPEVLRLAALFGVEPATFYEPVDDLPAAA